MNKTKNRSILIALGVVIAVGIFIFYSASFIVRETQQCIVVQLGEVKRIVDKPGLNFKLPFIQDVIFYDKRIISIDPPIERIILADNKRLLVDTVTRYRINDPLSFYKTVGNTSLAFTRLSAIINSSTRDILGRYTLENMLNKDRDAIIERLTARVDQEAKYFGVELIDVRIRRADLPDETLKSVFERMRAERDREAREFRAEGSQISNEITSKADRDAAIIIAKANKQADELKATTDKQKYKILRAVMDLDPKFAEFYIMLNSYKDSLKGNNTTLVMSTDSFYLKYFGKRG